MGRLASLNDILREDGLWWLPTAPENKIAGTLTFDQISGAKLKLIGLLSSFEDTLSFSSARLATIFGTTKSGKNVSLIKCHVSSRSVSFPGMAVEEYYAHIAAFGLHFEGMDDEVFTGFSARYAGMEQWLGHQPFKLDVDFDTKSSACG